MSQIAIKQVKSRINCPAVQKRTLDALGLRKMNHTVVKEDTPSIRRNGEDCASSRRSHNSLIH